MKNTGSNFEELSSRDGYAAIVYLPKRWSGMPALVIELKWNATAEGAIAQIKRKKYPDVLKNYGSEILLVGINYDKDAYYGSASPLVPVFVREKKPVMIAGY